MPGEPVIFSTHPLHDGRRLAQGHGDLVMATAIDAATLADEGARRRHRHRARQPSAGAFRARQTIARRDPPRRRPRHDPDRGRDQGRRAGRQRARRQRPHGRRARRSGRRWRCCRKFRRVDRDLRENRLAGRARARGVRQRPCRPHARHCRLRRGRTPRRRHRGQGVRPRGDRQQPQRPGICRTMSVSPRSTSWSTRATSSCSAAR